MTSPCRLEATDLSHYRPVCFRLAGGGGRQPPLQQPGERIVAMSIEVPVRRRGPQGAARRELRHQHLGRIDHLDAQLPRGIAESEAVMRRRV